MGEKNSKLRQFLAKCTPDYRSKNCFRWGNLEIKTGVDSPYKGVEFTEYIMVSVYDSQTNCMVQFSVKVDDVTFIKDAI